MNKIILEQEEKEYVYIPKSLAKKIKDLQDGKVLEAVIVSYVEESKQNMKAEIESIEEDILQYRAYMVKAKNAFKEAKEEQLNAAYELWEKFEDDMKGIRNYVSKAKKEIEPLKEELESLRNLMSKVNEWDLSRLLSIIQQIRSSDETWSMLKFLLDNYKNAQ